MSLSWNEIKTRAAAFVNEWKDIAPTAREEADAQTFETGFFHIFGVERSQVAIFEQKVRLSPDANGYIDLFWKGHIMIEMKSPGKDMFKAFEQAKNYANALKGADLPKCILICDFNHFHCYDLLDNAKLQEFALADLVQYIELFSDLAGYKDVEYKKQDAVNIAAAEKMGRLHDRLKDIGYTGHQLEVYLVRILFCLFADDTGIFEHDSFIKYILQRTNVDGSDLALHLQKIFEILNKPQDKRLKTIDEQLDKFPYVNGGLFAEPLEIADFDSRMREALIECCALDWGKISPAIFGSMFQSVMNEKERRNLGAHYTSEENILKLIHPLFLDDLWAEFDKYKALKSEVRVARLNTFHDKLGSLKFLDPACGCGNFLIITYRELRILELAVIKELLGGERILDVDTYVKVNVNQFYGIEIEEFPSKIAQVAMWLMDHQMNMLVRDMFGEYYVRIPLRASPSIVCANSLRTDWESVVPKSELSYILGNPPFVGCIFQNEEQKNDMRNLFSNKNLDFVAAWYKKAAIYIQNTKIECAFVSTNSICQGEQVSGLWSELFAKYQIRINFAHQTFKWSNEARGNAAVFCVIVGFSTFDRVQKRIYLYTSVESDPVEVLSRQINPYLVDAENIVVTSRTTPLCDVPIMGRGSQPTDNGNFLFSEEEYKNFVTQEPNAAPYIKQFMMGYEFINNIRRYCLWLVDCPPDVLKKLLLVRERVENIREYRMKSTKEATRKKSSTPTLFDENHQPTQDYIGFPQVSSERRRYIPIGFLSPDIIAGNKIYVIPNATLFHFGVLTSLMHMAWIRYVAGRLKNDFNYTNTIVYNNFPWPTPNEKQKEAIEKAAQDVLDARKMYPNSSLADLYDPDLMPAALVKTHTKLDRLVEKAYGKTFTDDSERVSFLFEEYRKLTEGLFVTDKTKKRSV